MEPINVLDELRRQQQATAQQTEGLTQRLQRLDQISTSVDPQVRSQLMSGGGGALFNPLDSVQTSQEFSEQARNRRMAASSDLANARQQNISLLQQIGSEQRRGGAGSGKSPLQQLKELSETTALLRDNPELAQLRPDLVGELLGVEVTQPEAGTPASEFGALLPEDQRATPEPQVQKMDVLQSLLQPRKVELQGKEKRDYEQSLRTELEDAATKNDFFEIRNANRTVQSAKETAAGDLSLIFSYMKILDPGSTVREGEFANAQNAAGIPDQIRNLYNRVQRGERLNKNQRMEFKDQANQIYNTTAKRQQELNTLFEGLAQQAGADPKNVTSIIGDIKINEQGTVDVLDKSDPRIQQALDQGWSEEKIKAYLESQ